MSAAPKPIRSPLVGAPLLPTLSKLAVPGVFGALIQTLLPVLEAWYLARTGTAAKKDRKDHKWTLLE